MSFEIPLKNLGFVGADPPSLPETPATSPLNPPRFKTGSALEGLHSAVRNITIVAAIILIATVLNAASAYYIDTPWFADWRTYRFLFTTVLSTVMLTFVLYAAPRNLTRIFALHAVVIGIWLFLLIGLTVWTLVDLVYDCPNNLRDFCTDTITTTIENGYWFYAASVWAQLVLYILELVFMQQARKHSRSLFTFGGITEAEVQQMAMQSMWQGRSARYIKGIGSAQAHVI